MGTRDTEAGMEIFGNPISKATQEKALKQREKFKKKFKYNPDADYPLTAMPNKVLGPFLGVQNLEMRPDGGEIDKSKGVIIGTIRMGYGHYRIAMAAASAAHSMGLTPYWMDLMSYTETTGGRIISHLNKLYSLGSRLSQRFSLFNKLYWEPLTAEGFKKLDYNASDREMCTLMAKIFRHVPDTIPVVGAHGWPSLAALSAGMKYVVNMIPDNWPLGLHLAEGALHAIQSPSAYLGYRTLKNMGRDGAVMKPMPSRDIRFTGHYVDHELASNADKDSALRIDRMHKKKPRRILIPIGGAGAQGQIIATVVEALAPLVKEERVVLYINSCDHRGVYDMLNAVMEHAGLHVERYTEWSEVTGLARKALADRAHGVHHLCNPDLFASVYATNLLMRSADILVVKPGEFSFYPIPKLLLPRVGGHEAWGAIRSAELGDGTIECGTVQHVLQALDLLVTHDDLLSMYCEQIIKLKKAGMYDGAYNVIKMAMDYKKGKIRR